MMKDRSQFAPRMLGVATSNPGRRYSQFELLERFNVTDQKIAGLFVNSHIESRYLCLPKLEMSGEVPVESSLELWNKHKEQAVATGKLAITSVLERTNLTPNDIDYIVCVTSTGFLTPGLTAHFIKELGLRSNIHRIDLVGMGCHGGLNGMQPIVNYCKQNPHSYGILVCVEICSAAYVFENTLRTAVVNSLFGDGCAAAILGNVSNSGLEYCPEVLGFESHIIPEHIDAMRFDYDGNKYSFFLDREIPYVLGRHAKVPVTGLLSRFGMDIKDVKHWVIHTGGKKVLEAIKQCLGLSDDDIRHSVSILRDFGNQSSGSFLFSYQRLIEEQVAKSGDYMMMMTMGPGSTIECGLARF